MSSIETILPHELGHALDGREGIRMLSLDCFDTLLWRDVHAPTDLFGLLGDITPEQRGRAERTARKAQLLVRRTSGEVTLREIYAALSPDADPDADDADVEARVAHEIAVEARHCHAFAPTVDLMRAAKSRGMPIVVVSDTYLERDQLAGLIRAAAGDEVADLIDHIFCSCEHRRAKGEGLFDVMLAATKVRPDRILHIGDNRNADAVSGTRHGLRTLHLVQFGDHAVQRLRQEKVAGALMAATAAGFQPHRAAIAIGEPQQGDAASVLGYGVLGPIFTSFARWLADEADAIRAARGGRVHMLFLLRDGHLPHATFAAMMPDRPAHRVEISRFTAVAAGLGEPGAVDRFVRDEIGDDSGRAFLRQLLLDDAEIDALIAGLPADRAAFALAETVRSGAWTGTIATRGAAFADRLVEYLRTVVDTAAGDTVMLVDLGYNGTVQDRIETVLARRLGVHVAGRYLLLSEDRPSSRDKRGMIDRRALDGDALATLMASIAVIEQLCTVAQGSVIDYADGAPVRAAIGIKGRQSEVRAAAQAACVRFAHDHAAATIRATDVMGAEMARQAALAALARFLYLPLPQELAVLTQFEHDANLGTDEKVALFDPVHAASGLRERGLFYLKGSKRMFLPAELRGQGLPTSMTLLTQRRFGLDLRYADFCDGGIDVPVLLADGQDAFTDHVRATPTHDGYHIATIPVGVGRYAVGVQFGRGYEWVQIQSACFLPVAAFLGSEWLREQVTVPAIPSCEGMEQIGPHLFRCDGPESFLMVPPPGDATVPMMLAVVFRPIVEREAVPPAEPVPNIVPAILTGAVA